MRNPPAVKMPESEDLTPLSLFRCAASYAWDDMKELCRRSAARISETKNMPNGRHTQALREALVSCDEWGNTALHICVFNGAPIDAIDALLTVAERCARPKVDLTLLVTLDGSTPLLIGCAIGVHVDVLRLLIDKSADPRAMSNICDERGRTPLLELCDWYNQKGRWKVKPVAPDLDRIRRESELETWMSLRFWWVRVKVVLVAAAGCSSRRSNTVNIIEMSAHASPSVPPILSDLIFRIKWADNNEETSYATALDIALTRDAISVWTREHYFNNAYYIRQLLRSCPTAASLLDCDNIASKRSLLCKTLASGLTWSASNQISSSTVPGAVQLLWEVFPDTLTCKDGESGGLYPFMLAACSAAPDDRTGIETVYHLLRLSPQLIEICTGRNKNTME